THPGGSTETIGAYILGEDQHVVTHHDVIRHPRLWRTCERTGLHLEVLVVVVDGVQTEVGVDTVGPVAQLETPLPRVAGFDITGAIQRHARPRENPLTTTIKQVRRA